MRGVWGSLLPALVLCLGIGSWIDSQVAGGWLVLGAKIALYSAVYVMALWGLAMNREEKAFMRQTLASRLPGIWRA